MASSVQPPALDFNAVYLDTNVLIEANWPSPSIYLRNTLSLVGMFGIPIFLPEPVEKEAEAHWVREIGEPLSKLESNAREFMRLARNVGGTAKVDCDSQETLVARYREASKAPMKELSIVSIPTTSKSVGELFDRAIRYALPFEEGSKNNSGKGRGFQDAVILLSVLEHLEANGKLSGLFVSSDTVFAKVSLKEFAPEWQKAKIRFGEIKSLFDVLYAKYWDEAIKTPWEEERKNAKLAAEAALPAITEFVRSTLNVDMLVSSFGYQIKGIQEVQKVEVLYAQTPMPDPAKPNRNVTFAIAIGVNCMVLTESDNSLINRLFFGIESPPQLVQSLQKHYWMGGVEASADVRDRQYGNLRLLSLVSAQQLGSQKWFNVGSTEEAKG